MITYEGLLKPQKDIVDQINNMQVASGKSYLIAYLFLNDKDAIRYIEEFVSPTTYQRCLDVKEAADCLGKLLDKLK